MNNFIKSISLIFLVFFGVSNAQEKTSKKLFIPAKVWYVPENNNYDAPDSDYSYSRMIESDNIAMFWHKEYGSDPMLNADEKKRFDPKQAIAECERFYNFYVNDLKLVQKGHYSVSDKYKLLIYVFGGDENTAFGGGEGEVGVLWTPAARINKIPYGALAHEIGHSFQYMSQVDSKTGPDGPVMEMSAQYMLWQVYPEWMTFENYHLKDFLKGTHYAFLHPVNMYHSPYVLEYWSQKHGIEFWGNLCRSTQTGEDVVMTYKRINSFSQEQFNDEIFDASRKFITWDLKRVEDVAKPYRNMHTAKLNQTEDGWYQIDASNSPQDYGYNGIKLTVPTAGTKVKLSFKGLAGANGYTSVLKEKAGWRYGFVASLKDGNRVYSKVFKNDGKAEFTVPKNTEFLWLVVSGAPTEHEKHSFGNEKEEYRSFPYKVNIVNAKPL
ncbi:DUF6055 domain-containing protein [Flavobacterium aquicola]|uniref:Uncharacterized protein n=1 Tax=Flavobacterium aquicola TaxID=1682742 RepID=A0A3E0ERT0_9FLAO|nr:DUF6055 domain-containing protein [Flavobacterium aquicola]REH00955.1 hypothetical protein C8P67_102208 [Flavobacterium aquicola]